MALLKTSKSSVGGLTTLRDDLKNMLKPSAPTFANVSTESFHDFATAPNAQLIGKNVEDVAEHLRTTFTSSLENMGYSAVATGELKTNSGAFRHNDNSFLGNSEPIPVVFEILAYHGPWRNFNVLIYDGAADPAAFANLHIPE